MGPSQLTILTIGLARPLGDDLLQAFRVVEAAGTEDALRRLAQEEVAVLVLGSRLAPDEAFYILTHHSSNSPDNSTAAILLLCAGCDPELFQPAVNEGHIFYMAREGITGDQLRLIIVCGAARFRSQLKGRKDPLAARVARIDQLLDFCIRVPMQADLPSAAGLLIAITRELINAEFVQYLVYDAEEETLTPAGVLDNKGWSESAAAGLAAFVARTGERIRLDCIGMDPRYDFETDNPGGREDARFMAEPLIGPKGLPVGVITATRSGQSIPFSEEDAQLVDLLAECAAPTFNQIALQNRVQALLLKRAEGSNSDVFREEALEYHIRSWDQQGDILKTLPAWLGATYWVMLALVFVGLLGTVVGKLNVYASGPAVIRANRATMVTAVAAGRVHSVVVSPGEAIKAGDTLFTFDGADASSAQGGRADRLRAPADGIVGDIRIHPGQLLETGDPVMRVAEPDAGYDLIAFLPESQASQLHPGMVIRLQLPGESRPSHNVPIHRVGSEVLDRAEAARYAGKEDAANFPVTGRVVVVRAFLPTVNSGGSSSLYYDGATGEAEVSVRSESAIVALIPGLRKIFGKAE
ncbi:MAG: HlyD family efflux transporter periplasmic adaptor subunit [Candidatus Sulfotelmatobacter sp.]